MTAFPTAERAWDDLHEGSGMVMIPVICFKDIKASWLVM
jgi:hypothetical protein